MRSWLAFTVFLLAPCSPSAGPLKTGDPASLGFSHERLQQLKARMQAHVDSGRLNGLSTAVIRDGQIVHLSTHGYQDRESSKPLSRNAIFRIYSMTKAVTAVAAMMLYEQGHFQLFDPIETFIPEFKQTQVFVGGTAENPQFTAARKSITIRDLFLHTACFTYPFTKHPVDQIYNKATLFDGKRNSAQFVSTVAKLPLKCQPGSQYSYGVSTDVLGRIIELVSGLSLDDYMTKHIFKPLGMVDTGFYVPKADHDRLMMLYVRQKNGTLAPAEPGLTNGFLARPKMAMGGGGLVSTVDDYLKFLQMLLNGGQLNGIRLLSPRTVDFMFTDHLSPKLSVSPGYGMGFGFAILRKISGHRRLGTVGEAGWSGIANTFFWIDRSSNTAFIGWTQMFPWGGPKFRFELPQMVYGAMTR
ncbi:MAG: serine hydrolase domain-containing protein [Myxococcota bacterium]|nr:serine hydrolase domain-containing protein [Myxococcota bacterium]